MPFTDPLLPLSPISPFSSSFRYEERENLPLMLSMLHKAFTEAGLDWEVVVVEDSSPDGTYEVALDLARVYGADHVKIHKRPGKMGLGSAYKDGLHLATGNFVFLMDADLSHHPKFIPDFIAEQAKGDYDVVTGTRYRMGGAVYGWNLRRKLTSRVANYLAQLMLAPGASDLTGSFRLYKRSVLGRIMEVMESKGYVFQMEIIVRAKQLGFSVGEVPISFVDRIYGESKLGAMEIVAYLKGLWSLFKQVS